MLLLYEGMMSLLFLNEVSVKAEFVLLNLKSFSGPSGNYYNGITIGWGFGYGFGYILFGYYFFGYYFFGSSFFKG